MSAASVYPNRDRVRVEIGRFSYSKSSVQVTRDATKIAKVINSIFAKDRFVSRRSRENEEKRRGKSKSTLHAFNLSLSLRRIEISFGW